MALVKTRTDHPLLSTTLAEVPEPASAEQSQYQEQPPSSKHCRLSVVEGVGVYPTGSNLEVGWKELGPPASVDCRLYEKAFGRPPVADFGLLKRSADRPSGCL